MLKDKTWNIAPSSCMTLTVQRVPASQVCSKGVLFAEELWLVLLGYQGCDCSRCDCAGQVPVCSWFQSSEVALSL